MSLLRALLFAALFALAPGVRADKPLPFGPLGSNGVDFTRDETIFPLRCLEAKGLLDMQEKIQDDLLDKAAAAGFNSVSFEAPLFGSSGFCKKLGAMDKDRVDAFLGLISKLESRELYALPVLWDAESSSAFARAAGGMGQFFSGKVQNQWQAWLLGELAKSSNSSLALSSTAAIGGWILYRGPWPGPKKRGDPGLDQEGSQAFSLPLRGWLLWQMRALRKAGARQLAGVDFLLRGDLGEKAQAPDAMTGTVEELPLADPLSTETKLPNSLALDRLPPLLGEAPESETGPAEALTPWDLEGVDWDSVGRALREIPVATGLDFMQLSLDTEDWFRVGEAMAGMAEKEMQCPLVWRQDWRVASRYERQKRLGAPENIAGLMGPWPEDDWPEAGESIWPSGDKAKPMVKALAFKYLELKSVGGKPVIELHLNRKATVELAWGRHWPPDKHSASLDAGLVHSLSLRGAKFGENILFSAKAKSKGSGRAVLRSRWMLLKAPQAAPSAKP